MDIVHATILTPLSRAVWISSSRDRTFFCFMIIFIIFVPRPPMFILERASFAVPLGIIIPNIFSTNVLDTLTFLFFLRILSPQNVKNMVTGRPIAAAPLAMIKDARALSKSPSNTTIVFPWGMSVIAALCPTSSCFASPFRIVEIYCTPSFLEEMNVFPVRLHHFSTSFANPISVAETRRTSPSCISDSFFDTFMIGPGHCMPQQSRLITLFSSMAISSIPLSQSFASAFSELLHFPDISSLSVKSSLPIISLLSAISSNDGFSLSSMTAL